MIMLMIIALLIVLGLCFGSFVNALVWRLHEQANKNPLSIIRGRSMCPRCKHSLGALDLVPVLSWLGLRGKCRYCHKPISVQYPLVEIALPLTFVLSYLYWPVSLSGAQIAIFVLWLVLLIGLLALLVYDLRWMLLPNRIVYPLMSLAAVQAIIAIASNHRPLTTLLNIVLAILVGGGIFYALFQLSKGKWIGGGDVKLGFLLGIIAGTPARSFLVIFVAALSGSLISLPLLVNKRLKRNSVIPFGPFLILAMVIVQLAGAAILSWYQRTYLPFTV